MRENLRVHVQEKTVDTDTKAKTRSRLPWQENDEKELIKLAKQGMPIRALAERFHRQPEAVRKKLERLGLNMMASKIEVSGKLIIAPDLPSLEEVLKIVAGAIYKACQAGLGKTELQRLDTIATLYKAYAAGLEQYVGYRKIEASLAEMKKEIEEYRKEAKSSKT